MSWLLIGACAAGSDDAQRSAGAASVQAGRSGEASASTGSGGAGASGTAVPPSAPAASAGSSGTSVSGAAAGAGAVMAGRGSAGGRASAGAAGRAASRPSGSGGAGGAPPATGELFKDDFEDGDLMQPSWIDADPELQAMWVVMSAEGTKVLGQTAPVDDWVFAAAGDYRWTDQTVEAKVKLTSEPGKAGIFARVRDAQNYYFLYLDGGSNLVLRKRVDNSSSDVMKVKVETQQNVWYTLALAVRGETLEGYLDGKLLVTGSDAGVKTGGVGVGTSDCTAQFDDVTVRN